MIEPIISVMGFFFRDGVHMLKKTTLAVLGLAASGFAFAGAMGPVCTPGNVTVACEPNRWDLGVQALYLSAIYGAEKGLPITMPTNSAVLKPNWNWGFEAEGSYHFNAGNDVTVDWTHYSSINGLSGFSGLVPVPFVAPAGIPDTFQVSNENRLDQVNLVMGQHADLGAVSKMRLYGGLQYANLQVNVTNFYNAIPGLPPQLAAFTLIDLFSNADFKGLGPVVGIDYSYDITSELSLTGSGSGSILYGTSRFNSGFVAQAVGLNFSPMYAAVKQIVPTVEAKLGLNYAYNMAQGVVNFEGGYQILNYFTPLRTASLVRFNTTTSFNYGLYGPYLGVKYLGNA